MGGCICSWEEEEGWMGLGYNRWKERRRQVREYKAAEAKSEELLSLLPGRICSNGATLSSSLFIQQGGKGINQDASIIWERLGGREDTVLCGVFDGHGPNGHFVARRIRDSLPSKLAFYWNASLRGDHDHNNNNKASAAIPWQEFAHEYSSQETSHHEATSDQRRWKDAFLKAFQMVDQELKTHPLVDCYCSGSTTVVAIRQGDNLVIANLGDSRAILGRRRNADSAMEALQLTMDLKPNLPKEAERIRKCKGRVLAFKDEPGVARLWLPDEDAPGLAMARAFGDFCLKDYGLISVPEITYHRLAAWDEFLVVASDGIWDVLSNEQVAEIAALAGRSGAAKAVVETAVQAWRLKFPGAMVDDCTAVCMFFNKGLVQGNPETGTTQSCQVTDNAITEELDIIRLCPVTTSSVIDTAITGEPDSIRSCQVTDSSVADNTNAITGESDSIQSCPVTASSVADNAITGEPDSNRSFPVTDSSVVDAAEPCGRRSLGDWLRMSDVDQSLPSEEWTALDGLTRANSLLRLSRFHSGDRKKNS